MPLDRDLKRRILQNPFGFYLHIHDHVDREAYQRLVADLRRLVDETRDDREIDKEILQSLWSDIRVAEGTGDWMDRGGASEEVAFEVQNMAIELDAILIELVALEPASEDWGWVGTDKGPPGYEARFPNRGLPTRDP